MLLLWNGLNTKPNTVSFSPPPPALQSSKYRKQHPTIEQTNTSLGIYEIWQVMIKKFICYLQKMSEFTKYIIVQLTYLHTSFDLFMFCLRIIIICCLFLPLVGFAFHSTF